MPDSNGFTGYRVYRATVRVDDRTVSYVIRSTIGEREVDETAARKAREEHPRAGIVRVIDVVPEPANLLAPRLADRIRAVRHTVGESRAVFAARFHVKPRTVERWEQGAYPPNDAARKIFDQLEARLVRRASA